MLKTELNFTAAGSLLLLLLVSSGPCPRVRPALSPLERLSKSRLAAVLHCPHPSPKSGNCLQWCTPLWPLHYSFLRATKLTFLKAQIQGDSWPLLMPHCSPTTRNPNHVLSVAVKLLYHLESPSTQPLGQHLYFIHSTQSLDVYYLSGRGTLRKEHGFCFGAAQFSTGNRNINNCIYTRTK